MNPPKDNEIPFRTRAILGMVIGAIFGLVFVFFALNPSTTFIANQTQGDVPGNHLYASRIGTITPFLYITTAEIGSILGLVAFTRDLGSWPLIINIVFLIGILLSASTGIGLFFLLPIPVFILAMKKTKWDKDRPSEKVESQQ